MGLRPFCCLGVKFQGCLAGTLSPDISGDFVYTGMYNGQPYFKGGLLGWSIWYSLVTGAFVISEVFGVLGTGYWIADQEGIVGTYAPEEPSTGVATFTEGVCT